MQVDKTTLYDLSIFSNEEEFSIFHHINFTQTADGKNILKQILASPLNDIETIVDTQKTIQFLISVKQDLPKTITNGTLMVIEKFYLTPIEAYPEPAKKLNTILYKYLSKPDFFLTKYSVNHFIDFIQSLHKIVEIFKNAETKKIASWKNEIEKLLSHDILKSIILKNKNEVIDIEILHYALFFKNRFKQDCNSLIYLFSTIDAFLSLAIATEKYQYHFPEFINTNEPRIIANQLHHPLLKKAVGYDFNLQKENNFLFLTGANMAGKSTFIKALGIGVYLAHIGMSVPVKQLQLSYFNGLLSNIQIVDNISKNESFFYNEVQRIKNTIEKVNDKKNWLILIDELFKGTNIHDAMKCSVTVIDGLQKRNNALYVLSTHLYEIGEQLSNYKNIQFKYFETAIVNNEMEFSFQLKDGISDDRLGYMILEKEGVVDLLKN